MSAEEKKEGMVNIGCLGCGGHGLGNNYRQCADNPLIHIRAMCDLKEDLLEKGRQMYSPDYVTTDFHDMLDDPEIDAILAITSDEFHAPLSVECLRGGKHVFTEKPMGVNLEECQELIRAQRETGKIFMVGTNRRFAPIHVDLKNYLKNASVSKELADNRKAPVIYYRIVDDPRNHATSRTDVIWDRLNREICHIFDLFNFFFECEPVRVFAMGEVENRGVIQIEYEDGGIGVIIEGGIGNVSYPKEYMEVFAHGVTAVADWFHVLRIGSDDFLDDVYYEYSGRPDHKVIKKPRSDVFERSYRAGKDTLRHFLDNGTYSADTMEERLRRWEELVAAGEHRPPVESIPVDKGHYAEHEAFRQAIVTGAASPIDAVAGTRAFVMGRAAAESLETGRPVDVDRSLYLFD